MTTVRMGSSIDGQVVDRGLDLAVVELAHLVEHVVERTGLLADLDHLGDQGRDDVLVLAQGVGQRPALRGPRPWPRAGRSPTIRLPAVSDTMSSDSRMGTPDWISDASVCEKRASDTLWISCPKIGGLSLKRVPLQAALVGLDPLAQHRRSPPTIMATSSDGPRGSGRSWRCSIRIWVGSGSLACSDVNSFWKTGTMKMSRARKMTTITRQHDDRVGHGRPDRAVAARACFSMVAARSSRTASRFPPTSPAWTMVHEEVC